MNMTGQWYIVKYINRDGENRVSAPIPSLFEAKELAINLVVLNKDIMAAVPTKWRERP